MPPALKTLGAIVAAVAMVVAAVLIRGSLDTKKERDDLRLTVACDPLAEAFCQAAKRADQRLEIRPESPDVTTRKLVDLAPGQAPDFQAWVTVGPWMQMADGRRRGQAPLQEGVTLVASSPVVLVTRPGVTRFEGCSKPLPAACLPLPRVDVGLSSPRTSGVGLAGLSQVILADTGIGAADLDLNAIQVGPAAAVIDRLARETNPGAGREQVNARFAGANPVVTTQAAASEFTGAGVIKSEPAVRAILQVGILDSRAASPLGGEPGGRALAQAAMGAGWEAAGNPDGGLPEPGVLAALQDAWTGP